MQRTALLLVIARTNALVPDGGILRGRVHVVLEGDATPPPGDAVQVVLGTGETAAGGWGDGAHPSTALCLEWLSERGFKDDESFLDYGCGSGVLAIAARKLGCREAVGVDVEYEALDSAAENAERNGIVDGVEWVHGRSIIPGNDEYDAVVANILVFRGASRIMTCTPSTRRLLDGAPDSPVDLRTGRPALPAVDGRYSSSRNENRRRAVPVGRPAGPVPRARAALRAVLRRRREDLPRPGRFREGVLGLLGPYDPDKERSRSEGASREDQRRGDNVNVYLGDPSSLR